MLMSTQANRYAYQLLDVRSRAQELPLISDVDPLALSDGYEIAKRIYDIRVAQGETPVGRKIGFTNRSIWSRYGAHEAIQAPIWAPVFDSTVRYTEENRGLQSLDGAVQPRIEPELVFKLGKTPEPDASLETLADSIEWMAHAFEIVVCPFPEWKFDAADAVAAFGLHGLLIIGEPHVLASAERRNLAKVLSYATVSLSRGDALQAAGFGSHVMESPVHALWHLHRLLQSQPEFPPLQAGEIITTGTWTDAYPIAPGETWTSAFSGVSLAGLTVSFV